jgi:hypothetical protein
VAQPITYIAPPSISEDSIVVYFVAAKSGGGAASSVRVPTKTSIKDSVKTSLKKAGLSLRIANILRAQGTIGGCPLGNVVIKNDFDKFKILLSRDTLKNREISTVTVIAIDKDSNEVQTDQSKLINLNFEDLSQYVDFISASGDTVDVLTNVPYEILRSGHVKVIARGTLSGSAIASI